MKTLQIKKLIVEIVDRILAARKHDPAADISEMEQQVDTMVAKLYGLKKEVA